MKYVVSYFILSCILLGATNKASIYIYPGFNKNQETQARDTMVCADANTTKKLNGVSDYDQCIKMYNFKNGVENYYKSHLNNLKNSSSKVKLQTSHTSHDYIMFCGMGIMVDELKQDSGFYKWDDEPWYKSKWQEAMAKGIYYMQFNCEIINIITNKKLLITQGKTKVFSDGGLLDSKALIKEGKRLINRSFPKASELEKSILNDIKFTKADLSYHHNIAQKVADGKSKGQITISTIKPGFLSRNHLTKFELSVKQGTVNDNKKSIVFYDSDFLKKQPLTFGYKSYNCKDKGLQDKYHEIFTLKVIEQLQESKDELLEQLKVKFECLKPFYTLNVNIINYSSVKPKKNYRGIGEILRNYEKKHLVFLIYIDEDKGIIYQHLDTEKSYIKVHHEKYKLNSIACQFEKVADDNIHYLKNGYYMKFLKSEDNGWGLDDDSKIYIDLPHLKNKPYILWKRLKNSGYYSKNLTYSYEEPGLKMLQSVIDQSYSESTPLVDSKASKLLQAMVVAYAPSEQAKCDGKIVFESWFPGPLGSVTIAKPKIKAKISIRPSNENEINIMKKYLKRYRY